MTAPSALSLLAEVRHLHGHLIPRPPDKLEVWIPEPDLSRLLPAIRKRKRDLLMLLAKPEGPCPAGHSPGYWQDPVGQWHCEGCEPETPADPFGPLPAGEEDALAEIELRRKLRQPELAPLTLSQPVVSGSVRVCQIAAASVVWAASSPESIARGRAQAWEGIPAALVAGRRIRFVASPGEPALGEWVRTQKGTACEVLAYDSGSGEALLRTLAEPPRWAWFPAAALHAKMDWPE